MTIRHVLCPVDYSEFSRRASGYALALAREIGAKVTMLHAFVPDVTFGSLATVNAESEERRQLQVLRNEFPAPEGVQVDYVVKSGAAEDCIVEEAATLGVDLIVVGAHGRTGLLRVLMGSVAEAVVREAPCPVVAIKALSDSQPWVGDSAAGGIVCALDANDYDQDVVDLAASMAASVNQPLDVLHVTLFPDIAERPGCYGSPSNLIRDHRALRRVRSRVDNAKLNLHHLSGSPVEQVLHYVQQRRPRLLVLGTHARHGLQRLLGSTASKIMRKAECPVLVLRQGRRGESARSQSEKGQSEEGPCQGAGRIASMAIRTEKPHWRPEFRTCNT